WNSTSSYKLAAAVPAKPGAFLYFLGAERAPGLAGTASDQDHHKAQHQQPEQDRQTEEYEHDDVAAADGHGQRLQRRLNSFQGPRDVRPRHLLAPVHGKVGVVQRPRLQITGFGGSHDLLAVKPAANQALRRSAHLDRGGRDAAQHYPRRRDPAVFTEFKR